jgi:hypothetical protein
VLPVGGYTPTKSNDTDGTEANDSDADEATGATVFEVLTSGEHNTTYDAGYYRAASIGDLVWEDTNANGIQDNNEPIISGAVIQLSGTDGQGVSINQNRISDLDGKFRFDHLLPGSYQLTFPIPTGFDAATYLNQTADDKDADADPVNGNTTIFETLVSGEQNTTYDAAFYKWVSVGDKVWVDYNNNGEQNPGEPGMPNVAVQLTGTTGNGTPVSSVATTTASGTFVFNQLIPGTYTLTFTTPQGYLITTANTSGGNDETDSDINNGGSTPPVTLRSGQYNSTQDAGYYATDYGDLPLSYATVNGSTNGAYHVLNPNLYLGSCVDAEFDGGDDTQNGTPAFGICASGDDEDGITFVTPMVQGIEACIRVNAVNSSGTTAVLQGWADFNGDGDVLDMGETLQLSNSGLIPDGGVNNALFCFPVPNNATFQSGSAFLRFRLSPLGGLPSYGPAIGGEVEDYEIRVGKIGNLVWRDVNFNGIQDGGEAGIPNVGVELTWAGPDGNLSTTADNKEYNTVTNVSGLYYFCGVLAGNYQMRVLSPGMMTPGNINQTSDDLDSDGSISGPGVAAVTHEFTIDDPLNMPTGEMGLGDLGSTFGYADSQADETHDFGFGFLDYGDLPESGFGFKTTLASGGAVHATNPQLTLGTCVDGERDGNPDDDAGVYDELSTDSGDGDDGINTFGIDQQNCTGIPFGIVSNTSYFCENNLVIRKVNLSGQVEYYVVDGDFSPQINGAGGIAAVIGSTLIINGAPTFGTYTGNIASLKDCIAQKEGVNPSIVSISGTIAFNFACFDKTASCNDDENGVAFETPLIPGYDACIRVTAQNATASAAVLQGWIDWNGNGEMDNAESLNLNNGGSIPVGGVANAQFCFPVPPSATFNNGKVYARFRLSPQGGLPADGPSTFSGQDIPYGEIEDYIEEVGKVGNRIWEDRNYNGLQDNVLAEPGMNGVEVQLTWAGPDGNLSTTNDNRVYVQITATKNGALGMYYFCGLIDGRYRLTATNPDDYTPTLINQGFNDQLDADDFVNGDVFTWPDVANLVTNESGVNDMPGQIPNFPDKHDDHTHDMGYVAVDFGDHPSTYSTLNVDNGARATIVPGLFLGSGVDSESDGKPDDQSGKSGFGGDDNDPSSYNVGVVAATGDDENGFRLLTPLIPGYEGCIELATTATAGPFAPAFVSAWIDFSGNGMFDTAEKLTFTTIDGVVANTAAPQVPLGPATRNYCFLVPASASYNSGDAYFRIRLNDNNDIPPTGMKVHGEVEDHWQPLGKTGNFVWMDSDIEGDQDPSEMPLANVTMELRWPGADQLFNTADDRLYTSVTDANGRYGWLGLLPGSYRITPLKYTGVSNPIPGVAPNNKILTIPDLPPANDFNDSDMAPATLLVVPNLETSFLPAGEDGLFDANGQNGFPDNQEDNSLDAGFIDQPVIASALAISGIEKAASGTCGHFTVVMTVCIQNAQSVPLNNLQATLNLAAAFGPMFLGLIPNGQPTIVSGNAQQNPVINAAFNGLTNANLLNGTSGLLWPGQQVCIRLRFELNPTAPGAPLNPLVQANVSGQAVNFQNVPVPDFINGGQVTVTDLSDDGTDPLTTNPLFAGDTGGANDPTPLTDCWKISQPLVNNDIVNVSMDSTCLSKITSGMVLEGEADNCTEDVYPLGGYYLVTLKNPTTNLVLPNPLTPAFIGQTILVEVEHKVSCNKTWGKIKLEDKLAPHLICPPDITVACSQPLAPSFTGTVDIQDCSVTTTQITESVQDNGECGSPRQIINRTFIVTDIWNNQSTCSHTISVTPFSLPQMIMPADVTIDCESVYLNPEATAPANAGQPTINGSSVGASLCSATLGYSDVVTNGCEGNYDIIRTWVVTNSCFPLGAGNPIEHLQRIRVKDFGGPEFECPGNITVSTDALNCCATAPLPDVIITEGCSDIINLEARVTGVDPSSGNITTFTIPGTLTDFPGNNYWNADTLAAFAFTKCLPEGNTYIVRYAASDNCANLSSCEFLLTVEDLVPPTASCHQFTQVAVGGNGEALVHAETFNDNSKDYCHPVEFRSRRMFPNACQSDSLFSEQVKFCCADAGDTIQVVFRVYDVNVPDGSVNQDAFEGHFNDCMVWVLVEDKINPSCMPPANVTVSCENFDVGLSAHGNAGVSDNCCLDTTKTYLGVKGLTHHANLSLFDTICNKGTITRTFRVFDCSGNSSQCTQRIVVNYEQDYYLRFPNDAIVTSCDGTGKFGSPVFFGEDCELLGVSYEDQIFTVVPDACFEIERSWKIINWCTFNPNQPLIAVPNPNPNTNSAHPQNLPGPVLSPAGTPAPWSPTISKVLPGDPTPTNFANFWNPNANGYTYKQIVKILDTQDPAISNCPDSTVSYCDDSPNESLLWNSADWWDNTHATHDLCEGAAPLEITAIDSCSGSEVTIRYVLYLDLDADGSQETVINSTQTGVAGMGWNQVPFNNISNPNFNGGTPRPFDQRPVPATAKYGFALQTTNNGNTRTAKVAWNTQQAQNAFVVPELPHGKHRIQWFVEDGCGNETACNYEFVVRDCKSPTVVCLNGLSANVGPTGVCPTLWVSDFLQYADDNCTPAPQLVTAIRKKGAGNNFPLDANGNPNTQVIFDCSSQGTQLVEVWARDKAGNTGYCESYIIVQDNLGICPSDSNTAKISGTLATAGGNTLEAAHVSIAGNSPTVPSFNLAMTTSDNGKFHFNSVPLSSNADIIPLKDDDPLNGVSTYDLLLISKHILGIQPMDSPYKMIAADANKSSSITTFDVVELRKLILGIYTELPNNTSWRFIDKAFSFPASDNPFQTAFPETITLQNLQGNTPNQDFVALKVGDINGNAVTNSMMQADTRNQGMLAFDLSDRPVKAGEVFNVAVKAAERVDGFQFTLESPHLKVIEIQPEGNVTIDNFGKFEHAVTMSYHANEQAAFSLVFQAEKSGMLSEMLFMSSAITKAEAYVSDLPQGTQLRFRKEAYPGATAGEFELRGNLPNPFVDHTMVQFYLPEQGTVTIQLYDENSKQVYRKSGKFMKGLNLLPIDLSEVPGAGVLFYQLEWENQIRSGNMIQVR